MSYQKKQKNYGSDDYIRIEKNIKKLMGQTGLTKIQIKYFLRENTMSQIRNGKWIHGEFILANFEEVRLQEKLKKYK